MKTLAVVLFMLGSHAYAGAFLTGKDLLRQSTEFTTGFVAGAVDSLSGAGLVCVPPQTKLGEVHELVIAWVKNKPERRDGAAVELLFEVLTNRYPCVKQAPTLSARRADV
jgi:hypothetical protein